MTASIESLAKQTKSEASTDAENEEGVVGAEATGDKPTGGEPVKQNDDGLAKLNKEQVEIKKRIKELNRQRDTIERSVEKVMVMKERDDVRETFVLVRGQYDAPGEQVERDVPGFLPPLKKSSQLASRMDLAEWFVATENPLTARVAVNRFFQSFFGVGLVKTSEDFGNQGEVPSHPELLDELAVSFIESGWDVKALVKQIAMSKTYRQASSGSPEQFNHDPGKTSFCTGSEIPGKPSMGAWLSYGLGSLNKDLPDYVVMPSAYWSGKVNVQALYSRLWGSGFLPSKHQGTSFQTTGEPGGKRKYRLEIYLA